MEIACPSSHWHMATLVRNLEWKKRTNRYLQTCKPDSVFLYHLFIDLKHQKKE